MTNTTTKACECGCDQEVSGRPHRRYASLACRVRDHRRRARDGDPKPAVGAEKALHDQGAVRPPSGANDVTPSDRGRVRMDRRSAPTIDSEVPVMAEKALSRDRPVSTCPSTADVTLSDRPRVDHCLGCGEPMKRTASRWRVAIRSEDERGWAWATACGTCFWRPGTRTRGPLLPGELSRDSRPA